MRTRLRTVGAVQQGHARLHRRRQRSPDEKALPVVLSNRVSKSRTQNLSKR